MLEGVSDYAGVRISAREEAAVSAVELLLARRSLLPRAAAQPQPGGLHGHLRLGGPQPDAPIAAAGDHARHSPTYDQHPR